MKFFSYLTLGLIVLSSFACSKKDEDKPAPDTPKIEEPKLEATKWRNIDFTLAGTFNIMEQKVDFLGFAKDLNPDNYTIFHEDNTLNSQNYPFTFSVTYKIAGYGMTTDREAGETMPSEGVWSRNENILTIIDPENNQSFEYTIVSLSLDTLKLAADKDGVNFDNEGLEIDELNGLIIFERIKE